MKYVVLKNEEPLLFADRESHKDVAAGRDVLSAGFCRIETYKNLFDDLRAHCCVWGRSESLNIDHRPNDAELIESLFFS